MGEGFLQRFIIPHPRRATDYFFRIFFPRRLIISLNSLTLRFNSRCKRFAVAMPCLKLSIVLSRSSMLTPIGPRFATPLETRCSRSSTQLR
ncbi:MAG: hypothetical protein QOJ40_361 [Verrucomicrobiota bacterium]